MHASNLAGRNRSEGAMRDQGRRASLVAVAALILMALGSAHGTAVSSVLHPPSLRLQSASHAQLGRGSYLVAGGNPRGKVDEDDGVITIKLNLKPFLSTLRAQLARIADATAVVGSSVAAAGGSVAGFGVNTAKAARDIGGKAVSSSIDAASVAGGALLSAGGDVAGIGISAAKAARDVSEKALATTLEAGGQVAGAFGEAGVKLAENVGAAGEQAIAAGAAAAREALAQAQKAAGELEELIKANPNEAAAVGVTLAAVVALKAALAKAKARPEAAPALPPSLLEKIQAAAAASTESVGAALSSVGAAAQSMVVLPSVSFPSVSSMGQTLGSLTNSTVDLYLTGLENTLLLFGSVVATTVNVSNTCYVRAFQAVHSASMTLVDAATMLSKCAVDCGDRTRPHLDAVRLGPIKYSIQGGSLASGNVVLDLGAVQRVGGLLVFNRPAVKDANGHRDKTGTNDYKVYVSESKGKWVRVHQGWLRPGPGSGGGSASSQYLSFDGQWCRYVKFETTTAYKGGGGVSDIKVASALGLFPAWLYSTRPVDVVQSWFDSAYTHPTRPDMWGDVSVPLEDLADNVSLALKPLAGMVSNAAGAAVRASGRLVTPIAPVALMSLRLTYQATNATVLVTGKAVNLTAVATVEGLRKSARAARAASGAAYQASCRGAKVTYKGALTVANGTYSTTSAAGRKAVAAIGPVASSAVGRARAASKAALELSKASANYSYGLASAASKSACTKFAQASSFVGGSGNLTAQMKARWQALKLPRLKLAGGRAAASSGAGDAAPQSDGSANGCLPLTVLFAGGAIAYTQSEEVRQVVDPALAKAKEELVVGCKAVSETAAQAGAALKQEATGLYSKMAELCPSPPPVGNKRR